MVQLILSALSSIFTWIGDWCYPNIESGMTLIVYHNIDTDRGNCGLWSFSSVNSLWTSLAVRIICDIETHFCDREDTFHYLLTKMILFAYVLVA